MAGGVKSPLAFWVGGAGTRPLSVRSMLAFWAGGAAGIAPGQGSVRSLFAFWMGGASAGVAYGSPGRVDYQRAWDSRNRLQRDDEEILLIIGAFLTAEG